jgi:hypothetical protein
MFKLTGLLSWLKALTCSDYGLLALAGHEPVRQLVLYEKNFRCIHVWGLNLWLKASAMWGR